MTTLDIIRGDQVMPRRERNWGGWKLMANYELVYPAYPPGGTYPVDLEEFTSSAQVLDVIAQVVGKNWATPKCIAGLVCAIDDLLNVQAHLCSSGCDKRMARDQIKKLVAPYYKQQPIGGTK